MPTSTAIGHGPGHSIWPLLELIQSGELHQAVRCHVVGEWSRTLRGRLVAWWLTGALIRRARWHWRQLNLAAALDALQDARMMAGRRRMAEVLAARQRLDADVMAVCRELVRAGNIHQALQHLEQLAGSGPLEPEAESLRTFAMGCQAAEAFLRAGRPAAAIGLLEYLRAREPGCAWLDARIRWLRNRTDPDATGRTRASLLDETLIVRSSGGCREGWTREGEMTSRELRLPLQEQPAAAARGGRPAVARRMLLWIDGLGHYLVCTGPELWLGKYVPLSRVQVPVLADVQRRQLRMSRDQTGRRFLQSATGMVIVPRRVGGEGLSGEVCLRTLAPREEWETTGRVDCRLQFAEGLLVDCTGRRTSDATMVLRIASGQRTVPAAHAVVWMDRTLVIGPGADADIRCPGRRSTIVLRREGGDLVISCPEGVSSRGARGEPEGRPESGRVSRFGVPLLAGDQSLMVERLADDQELPSGPDLFAAAASAFGET